MLPSGRGGAGCPDDRGLEDPAVGVQDVQHLGGVHLLPTGDVHVRPPVRLDEIAEARVGGRETHAAVAIRQMEVLVAEDDRPFPGSAC